MKSWDDESSVLRVDHDWQSSVLRRWSGGVPNTNAWRGEWPCAIYHNRGSREPCAVWTCRLALALVLAGGRAGLREGCFKGVSRLSPCKKQIEPHVLALYARRVQARLRAGVSLRDLIEPPTSCSRHCFNTQLREVRGVFLKRVQSN